MLKHHDQELAGEKDFILLTLLGNNCLWVIRTRTQMGQELGGISAKLHKYGTHFAGQKKKIGAIVQYSCCVHSDL